eukprot:1574597-Prymnesium_polylepis.1
MMNPMGVRRWGRVRRSTFSCEAIGIVLEDWLRTPPLASASVRRKYSRMGEYGEIWSRVVVLRRPHTLHGVYAHPHAHYHPR